MLLLLLGILTAVRYANDSPLVNDDGCNYDEQPEICDVAQLPQSSCWLGMCRLSDSENRATLLDRC